MNAIIKVGVLLGGGVGAYVRYERYDWLNDFYEQRYARPWIVYC
jgi:fluoride ion exporter CrcB/FEX